MFINPCYSQTGPGGVGNTTGNSSLKLWLRADKGLGLLPNGKLVKTWDDQSGNGNHVSAPSGRRPTLMVDVQNGKPGVEFSGGQYLQNFSSSGLSNTSLTLFVVRKNVIFGTDIAIAADGSGWLNEFLVLRNEIYLHNSSGNFLYKGHQCIESVDPSEASILSARFEGSREHLELFNNGLKSNFPIEKAGTTWKFTEVDRMITIGQRNEFVSSEYLVGTLLEIIVYNELLSDSEHEAVLKYLCGKYNINNSNCGNLTECCLPDTTTQILAPCDSLIALEGYNWATNEPHYESYVSSKGCDSIVSFEIDKDFTNGAHLDFVPNIITPNNDGLNEYFPMEHIPKGIGFHLSIYNRWGEKLYDSNENNALTGWRGNHKGRPVPDGVYFYILRYRECDGEDINQSGAVHLIR